MKIESWPCHTTHSACNCVLERLYILEKEVEELKEFEDSARACRAFIRCKMYTEAHDQIINVLDKIDKARQG